MYAIRIKFDSVFMHSLSSHTRGVAYLVSESKTQGMEWAPTLDAAKEYKSKSGAQNAAKRIMRDYGRYVESATAVVAPHEVDVTDDFEGIFY